MPGDLIYPHPTTFFLPQMSILAPLTTIVLLFCGSTFSQISYPNCTSADFSWVWSYSVPFAPRFPQLTGLSRHITPSIKIRVRWPHIWQVPALMAVNILLPCMGIAPSPTVAWSIGPISPGSYYLGPNGFGGTDLCLCNSVIYSLMSACVACQGSIWTVYGSILSFLTSFYISAIRWPSWAFNCTDFSPPLT